MNHCVPDFEIQIDDDEEYPIPMSSGLPRPKKPSMANDQIMELLWENGQVVMQSQNQRPFKKPPPPAPPSRNTGRMIPVGPSSAREIRHAELENYHNQHLFMQEDEMTSWLQYSIDQDPPVDHNFCADLLSPPTTVSGIQSHNSTMQTPAGTPHVTELRHLSRSVPPRPPIPPTRRPEQVLAKIQNFEHFSKHNARAEPGPSSSLKTVARESTVVDSCDTPVVTAKVAAVASRASEIVRISAELTEGDTGRGSMSTAGAAGPSTALAGGGTVGRETTTYEMTVTSSPGGSSGSAEPAQRPVVEDRKRKGQEAEESEFQSEDVNFESGEAKKKVRGSTTTKRSRAADVHNLSERRRRDRINEKMKALQELIPRCNKSDKASMLDEAIEYLKSLQLQVQMMSMGCGMVPMMFPGVQQYMTPMGMGIGMRMSMEMGMNRPVMPFPNMLAGSALPAATAAAPHLGARFPMPPFTMPHVPPAPDSSRMQVANQSADNMITSLGTPDPDQSRILNFTDPYQQYFGTHQMQLQLLLNQAINQPNVSKPGTSRGQENPEKHQSEEI